jgi:hypothetical protein
VAWALAWQSWSNRIHSCGTKLFCVWKWSGGYYLKIAKAFHKRDEAKVSILCTNQRLVVKDLFWTNNSNDNIEKDTYKRIRLGYNSSNNYHRQVLLAFMDEKATSDIDNGYDGYSFDDFLMTCIFE